MNASTIWRFVWDGEELEMEPREQETTSVSTRIHRSRLDPSVSQAPSKKRTLSDLLRRSVWQKDQMEASGEA
jgi:hypothetical protein